MTISEPGPFGRTYPYGDEKLEELLSSGIEEVMDQIVGTDATRTIFHYLETNYSLKPGDILERPKVFSAALERLLGSGAPIIEKSILRNLYSKLELRFEEKEGYSFSDYVNELMQTSIVKNEKVSDV